MILFIKIKLVKLTFIHLRIIDSSKFISKSCLEVFKCKHHNGYVIEGFVRNRSLHNLLYYIPAYLMNWLVL